MNTKRSVIANSFRNALPIMLGYIAIGIPCGIMESSIGFTPLMCFLLSITFYSGAGQFMIPNLWLAGTPLYSVIASVAFVNTRQILYSAAFSPFFRAVGKPLSFLFSATVTDESFGVNIDLFENDPSWRPVNALLVNLMSMFSWGTANAVGCAVGAALDIPLAITSFAMTSIFICLLAGQRFSKQTLVVVAVAMVGVGLCKVVGLTGPAILLGAVAGVVAGLVVGPDKPAQKEGSKA